MLQFSSDPRLAEEQMHAVIFYLTAFGHIDGDFDAREQRYVREHIGKLVEERARQALGDRDPALRADVVTRWTQHFHEVADEIDGEILNLESESVADGESPEAFVIAKLKLRCYELFRRFDAEGRSALLESADGLIAADGVIDPRETALRDEIRRLLDAPVEIEDGDIEPLPEGALVIGQARELVPRQSDHPFLQRSEWDYARDPETFARQAGSDLQLIDKVMAILDEKRARGQGRLEGAGADGDFSRFAGEDPFLDGHVHVLPPRPGKDYELLVVGDLHGCYSCLKAALLQADFFTKVAAHQRDPEGHPETKLVLLGDYIDRGRYSYNGILRTAMQLLVAAPEHVYMLRGNHEYYVELDGRVLAPVQPAEAMRDLRDIAPEALFARYMRLFEALPNMLVFDRTLFVHAGIPRDETIAARWRGLASLNDPDIRFEMLWSDPADADVIPRDLQAANARFPFGRQQLRRFLGRLGLSTLVRGHERIVEGFRKVYDLGDAMLLCLFSAGGRNNQDLPEGSNYREVTPMALTIRHHDGVSEVTPFRIDYERYNDPACNAFLRSQLDQG